MSPPGGGRKGGAGGRRAPFDAREWVKSPAKEGHAKLVRPGVTRTVAGIARSKLTAAATHGGDDLADKARGVALVYGLKTAKHGAVGTFAVVRGTYRAAVHARALLKETRRGAITGKEARQAFLRSRGAGLAKSGATIGRIVKSEARQGVVNFRGSDDLGMRALVAPKDAYVNAKRAARVTGAVSRTARRTAAKSARFVQGFGKAAKAAMTSPAAFVKAGGMAGIALVFCAAVLTVTTSITSIVPSISLKSRDKELTRTYEHITELDMELTYKVRRIPVTGDADYFHFFLNGARKIATDITVQTDADLVLAYLDAKYDDYAFNKLIHGILGGTNVADEVTALHGELNSYSTSKWSEEVSHSSSYTDPDTGESVETSWTETVWHMNIYVSTQGFADYLESKRDDEDFLSKDEQARMTALGEAGTYTAKTVLLNPFAGEPYSISSRWGHRLHPLTGAKEKHTGLDIPKPEGTPIKNVMHGKVSEVGISAARGNYCKVMSSDGKRAVLYAHMQSVEATQGQTLKKGQIIGYVGSTGTSTGNHLHLEYAIESGFNTNPAFFLEASS